ncbi:MAG: Hint domain-containing protein [Maritimibacter sp.]|nr:Hint domain-containing protein [Maritimibacter sp.]
MSVYGLQIYDLGDAIVNVAGIIEQDPSGEQWNWHAASNPTFTLASGATPVQVDISDTDADPTGFADDSEDQVTTSSFTLGGTTYPAGTMLMDEYEITLTDGTNTYQMVAVGYREYLDPYTFTDQVIGFAFEGPAPPEGVTLSLVGGSVQDYASMVPCFTPGTLIDTALGPRPVETLRAGDRLRTPKGGTPRLLWVGRVHIGAARLADEPKLRPIRIRAGALAPGVPAQDLVVSPQHRILVRSLIAERIAGQREVLVAAKHLTGLPGIAQEPASDGVSYIHLLCARHVILTANGAATESLYPGREALRALSWMSRQAVKTQLDQIAPGAVGLRPARPWFDGKKGRLLAARHRKHARALQ